MLTCMIERASRSYTNNDIPLPGAYCRKQELIPKWERNKRGNFEIVGKQINREWAIQVESLEDLVEMCESYSGDAIIVFISDDPNYDFNVIIYDDYVE